VLLLELAAEPAHLPEVTQVVLVHVAGHLHDREAAAIGVQALTFPLGGLQTPEEAGAAMPKPGELQEYLVQV